MKKTLRALAALTVLSASAITATAPANAATQALASSYCSGWTQSSDGHTISVVCNAPGKQYYFQAYFCGPSYCRWTSSSWTADGKRAYISSSAWVSGVGKYIYYS